MEQLAPLGPVYQAGTLSGNPLATAAGLAVLDAARRRRLHDARRPGRRAGPHAAARARRGGRRRAGAPASARWSGCSSPTAPVTDYDDGQGRGGQRHLRPVLHRHARPGRRPRARPLRGAVPRLAHTWDDIERTVDLASAAIRAACARRSRGRSVERVGGGSHAVLLGPPRHHRIASQGRGCTSR